MRKLLIVLLLLISMFAFVACNGHKSNEAEKIEFETYKNSFVQHYLVLDKQHQTEFHVPIFAKNSQYLDTSVDYDRDKIKYIGAKGENLEDIKLEGQLLNAYHLIPASCCILLQLRQRFL